MNWLKEHLTFLGTNCWSIVKNAQVLLDLHCSYIRSGSRLQQVEQIHRSVAFVNGSISQKNEGTEDFTESVCGHVTLAQWHSTSFNTNITQR